ncbi:MAG TPA: TetR/AcrR family transcriptional regulator [Solirubrobacterales bacterium]|jgi:AcrR family transcriptional regulator
MPKTPRSEPPKPRKPQARGLARRKAILDAAVRLFAVRGFRGTGITGLAREVGISHVGLLHHFGTKENLLRAVVARRDAEQAELTRHLAGLRGLEALRAIELIGKEDVHEDVHTRLLVVLTGESLQPDDPLNGYFRDRYGLARAFLANAVRSGQDDGEIRVDADPETVAAEVMAFIAGSQVQWLLDPGAVDVSATYRDYVARLIADLQG